MRTRRIIVPRNTVFRYAPHPEFYGESIAILENGMATDVFTDDQGSLITETNDYELINYLKGKENKEEFLEISDSGICLQTVTFDNLDILCSWLCLSPFYRYDLLNDGRDMTRKIISHANTLTSHLFIISLEKQVGTIGFSIIDHVAIVDFHIYEHKGANDHELESAIGMLIIHIMKKFEIVSILSIVFDFEFWISETLSRYGFIQKNKPLLIPTIHGHQVAFEYEYPIKTKI